MRQRDIEDLAGHVRRRAGLNEDELVLAPTIAHRVLGTKLRVSHELLPAACLVRAADGRYHIILREIGVDSNFDVAHELGHFALREIANYRGAHEEKLASQVAAAILMPEKVVRGARARFGEMLRPVRPLARAALLSQTATQLRLGEVLEDGRAIVTRSGHVLLGDGEFWQEEDELVESARGARKRGIVKARLSGGIDEGRVALCASPKRRRG